MIGMEEEKREAASAGNAGAGCTEPGVNVGTGTNVPCSSFEVKPSGQGLLGDNLKSDRGLRVSGLAAMGAQVF